MRDCEIGSRRSVEFRAVQLADFHFDLPPELIAQRPLAERTASRLLALSGADGSLRDLQMLDLPQLLRRGDLLVFNDTRVVPARLSGRKPTGGQVEMLLERTAGERSAWMQVKASKAVRPGTTISTAGGELQVLAREADLWQIEFPRPVYEFLEQFGAVPLPPYVTRAPDAEDRDRYQSLLARHPGAVAAPTASLHFDAALLARLDALGVQRTCVTLHVGAGTFQPVRVADPTQHVMHPERFEIPAAACEALNGARERGARVVAIGTTVVRTLEAGAPPAGEAWVPRGGDTRIFIRPGVVFRAVDALLTNFHLPESTLLMLVSAFAGREAVLAAYRHAVEQRYRFFSYGDAMFITPAAGAREVWS